MVAERGVCDCAGCVVAGGACVVVRGVHGEGGMHGKGGGICGEGGMHGKGGMPGIRRDMVNERAVRILLECILVCRCGWLIKDCSHGVIPTATYSPQQSD